MFFYFKTSEQVAGEAIGGIIGFTIRLFIWSAIYSPFVFAFIAVFYLSLIKAEFHWLISLTFGLLASGTLLVIIGQLYFLQYRLMNKKNIIWLLLAVINSILIAGLPFWIGANIAIDILGGYEAASLFEIIIGSLLGGLLLGIPAYLAVTKNFDLNKLQESNVAQAS